MNMQKKMVWGLSLGLVLLCSNNLVCAADATEAKTESQAEELNLAKKSDVKVPGMTKTVRDRLIIMRAWTSKKLKNGGKQVARPFVWCGSQVKSLFSFLKKTCVNLYCKCDPRNISYIKSRPKGVVSRLSKLLFDKSHEANEKWYSRDSYPRLTMKEVVKEKIEEVTL